MLRSKKEEKAAAAAVANNVKLSCALCSGANFIQVKLAFMDDRKSKLLRDQREKQQREAREATAARRSHDPPSPAPAVVMPGSGVVLATGDLADDGDGSPSPYPEPSSSPQCQMPGSGHLLVHASDTGVRPHGSDSPH
jgi:hypothetical protein